MSRSALRPHPASPGSLGRAAIRMLCAVALAFSGAVVTVPTPAAAAGSISLDKTSSGSVLLGGEVQYRLAASNPANSGTEQYNLSYTDTLPRGVAYVGGSTSPTSFGEPQVITITDDAAAVPPVTHQVLVWTNVADVTRGATRTLTFRARVDATRYPIGSTVSNTASAFSSSDPREVPAFTAQGQQTGGDQVVSSTDSATTPVTAIQLTKSEASPESELLRGVNDAQTVYGLTVTNNGVDATSALVVTDYLPAGLEFLGCGGAFHSTAPEYPGAANTVATVTGCDAPASVDTVLDPAGYPTGVYTKITWNLGTIARGATRTIRYAAAVPQRANTMTWAGTAPTVASGDQAANLRNNTGPSTRETAGEQSLRNYATVAGDFQGAPVADATSHTVTAEDLRLVKTVSPTRFSQGGLATYTLTVDTSEYADLSALSIVDTIPAGLCPIDEDRNWTPLAECAGRTGHAPTNATISSVAANPDGSFTVIFTPDQTALAANRRLVITYEALMRELYDASGRSTGPTSANDSFTNHAVITGTSSVHPGVNAPDSGTVTVTDESSATITSAGPVLTKLRMPNTSPMSCSTNPSDYTATPPVDEAPFGEGDRVCFLLRVQFPQGVDTRNAQLTDFLPTNLVYESSTELAPGALASATSPTSPQQYVTWDLGTGTPRTVAKGTVFEMLLSARVATPAAASATAPKALDKENLAKFRYTNTAGESDSLRDSVSLPVGPTPPIGITKGVRAVNATGIDTGATPGNVDNVPVRGGDVVTFRVDLRNLSLPGGVDADRIVAPEVWDVLPGGITCADISAVSDAGTCFDAGAEGRPLLSTGNTTSSVLRWQLPATFTLDPQQYRTLGYAMALPANASVSTTFANTAAVVGFGTGTNLGAAEPLAVHHPAGNLSAGVPSAEEDVPAATDGSAVSTPNVTVTKTQVTDLSETGNAAAQAVVGETLTYTVGARVPAGTTVYNGRLADPLPTGVVFVGPASAAFSATGSAPAGAALPAGVTLDAATGTLTFGTAYANDTGTDQLFEVRIPARIGTDPGNTHGTVRTNTATFTSDTAATGGTPIIPRTAASAVTVVTPSPTLAKTVTPTSASGGDTVTYTVRAGNLSGRPPLHDAWVIDCLPGTLSFTTFTTIPAGTSAAAPIPGDGTNGCAAGFSRIAWNVGNLPGNGGNVALVYTAVLNTVPAGGDTYTNTASLRGSTLADGKTDPLAADNPLEQVLTATTTATVNVGAATITKSAAQSTMTIGQVGSFTVRVTIPRNTAFYDSAITDALPTGMSYVAGSSTTTCTNADTSPCSVPGTELTPSGATVGWLLGDLAPSPQVRTVVVSYDARMNDITGNTAGTNRVNTARYLWNRTDGTNPSGAGSTWASGTSNATAGVRVVEPGLTVTKVADDTTVEPGQTFHYALTVANNGRTAANLSPAYNYTVTDSVPAGIVVDPTSLVGGTLSGTDGNGSGGTITWGPVAGPLATSASITFSYAARLAPSSTLTAATRTNTGRATHYESLPTGGRTNYPPVSGTATVTPLFPHVTPAKSVAAGPAYLGRPKGWTLTLTSDGTADARHVAAVDTLPKNWTYDTGSAAVVVAGGAATQVEPALSTDGSGRQVLTWADLGTAPASGTNKTIVVTYTATPKNPEAAADPGVGSGVPHTNSVSATAQDATGATANASAAYTGGPASAATRIDSADVALTKTSGTAIAGQNLGYTMVVSNRGPDTAVGPFPVTDTLPSGLGAVSWAGTGWSCSLATTTLSCVRTNPADTLAAGASFPAITASVAIPAGTAGGTVLVNSASVGSATYDPQPANNTDQVTDSVERAADLGIVKTTAGAITAGTDATYTLDVTNHGPSDSAGPIQVTDTLPPSVTLVSATGSGWTCSAAGQALSCSRASGLVNGQAAPQITVVVSVPAGQAGTLRNTAAVSGPEADPKPANDTAEVTDPVRTSADLAITKAHRGTFVPGGQGTYVITVANHGPSDAASPVRVTDQLAPELRFVSDDSSAWNCAADGANLLTCTLAGGLGDSDSRTFEVTVAIDPDHTGDVTNSAAVSSPTTDPFPGNNTDGDSTGVAVESDLAITKSHTGNATAGTTLDFTLAVRNAGRSASPGPITVTDTLPAGMTLVSAAGTDWNCSADGREVTCTRASGLAAGTSAPDIILRARIAPDAGPATLTNRASVSGTAPDPEPGNNTSADEVTVVDRANVRIAKTASSTSADAGTPMVWTLTVRNEGPSDADGVTITDALPAGLQYVSIDAGPGVVCGDAHPVACTLATLAAGSSRQVQVRSLVGAGVADGTTVTNSATVSSSTPGDDPADNTDSATIRVTTAADLSLAKSHAGGAVVAGGQVAFDLAVANDGPSDASADVVVTDTLPAGMTFVSASGPAWSCDADPAGEAGQVVRCTLAGDAAVLAGSGAPALGLLAQVASGIDPDALADGALTNTAIVASPTGDPVPANNRDDDAVTVTTLADVSITKGHTGTVRIGDRLRFTLQVANAGPSTARGISVADTLPAGLEYVSAAGSGWSCAATGQAVTCDLDAPLPSGSQADPISVVATVLATAYPSVSNTATVTTDTSDPVPGDNSATDEVTVPAQVDLGITKSHGTQPLQVGEHATYTLGVSNAGNTDDPGPVTVTDTLPAGLSYVSGIGDGWSCSATGQVVTCTRAAGLAALGNTSVALVVGVGAAAYPGVLNAATVQSGAEDTNPDNNVAQDAATVLPRYDLSLDKELAAITDSRADWTLTVTNAGPNEAPAGTVVTDDLPSGLGYAGYAGEGWTCSASGRLVTCAYELPIAVGESVGLTLSTAIAPRASGTIRNTAGIVGGVTDTAEGKIPAGDGGLAFTGGAPLGAGLAGLVALLVGGALVLLGRRRA